MNYLFNVNLPDILFQIQLLQAMSQMDRSELLRILEFIESTLEAHWAGYGDFDELHERLTRLRMILEESPDSNGHGESGGVRVDWVIPGEGRNIEKKRKECN